jgi:thiamine biosynthesis lipoprotein
MKRKQMKKRSISLLLMMILLLSVTACGSSNLRGKFQKTGTYFDTVIQVTVYQKSEEKYLDGCMKLAAKYENLFSTTVKDSDISRINSAQGQPVEVSKETIQLIQTGIKYGELSHGAFDITVGKLSKLWQTALKEEKVPSQEEVDRAKSSVDYHRIQIAKNQVTLTDPETEIDLGGIAKGYIADQMRHYLEKNGVKAALINLGGNVLTLGVKEDGSSYTIGLQKPFSDAGQVAASVTVHDMSVVTSGTYERYFKSQGRIYHHLLDLKTGYPKETDVIAATVFTKNSVDGDALSTILFLMGPDQGIPFAESKGLECVYILSDGSIRKSSGIGKTIDFTEM